MRLALSVVGYFALASVTCLIFNYFKISVMSVGGLYFYLVAFYMAIGVWLVFKTDVVGALYLVTGAYAVQHIAHSLGNIIELLITLPFPSWVNSLLLDWMLYIVLGVIFFFLFVYFQRRKYESSKFDLRVLCLSLVVLAVCISLSSWSTMLGGRYLSSANIRYLRVSCNIYAIVSCALCIAIQFGFSRENKLTEEKRILDQLLHQEKERHEISKETVAVINAKCHDLKHQIALLENMDDRGERKEYIKELKKHVAIYDNIANTGNDALDIILSEKGLRCDSNNIQFSYMVDGAKLSFMSTLDVASLFGNALDNAIENQLLEDEEKRFISLTVREEGGGIRIHVDNYCSHEVVFDEGLPKTSKEDKEYHGFGVKSMQYVARKYGGDVFIEVKNSRFNLDIFFDSSQLPVQTQAKQDE